MRGHYDVVVIGSGTAGQTAAYALKRHGMTVALADHADRPGGVCALAGCQAKKWFYEATEMAARSQHLLGKGVRSAAKVDWGDVLIAKNKFTANVPGGTVQGLKEAGIDYLKDRARFLDARTLIVGEKRVSPDFTVIATGAAPMRLGFDGAEHLLGSDAFLEISKLPPRIAFVGGGFISFEFAHFAARMGPSGTRCTILEAASRPLAPFDADMVDQLVEISTHEGIEVCCDVDITSIRKTSSGFKLLTAAGRTFEADLVVHGAGRTANIESLDLEKAGIEFSRRGIKVTGAMATTNPRVFAVGDCAATIQLARVADFEAQVAADNIAAAGKKTRPKRTISYHAVPAVLFTYPQYAMVGLTEAALQQKEIAYNKSYAKNLNWPTYRRIGLKGAAYKVLTGKDGNVQGAHILSDNATGLINTFVLAMNNGIPVESLYRQSVMTPYPSRESDVIYMLGALVD